MSLPPDGTYRITSTEAAQFLDDQGMDPIDVDALVNQADEFLVTFRTEGEVRRFHIEPADAE